MKYFKNKFFNNLFLVISLSYLFTSCGPESRDLTSCNDCEERFYQISGYIYGLEGEGLIIELNNEQNRVAVSPGSNYFSFDAHLTNQSVYYVTVFNQPNLQICSLSNNSGLGVINGSNVTNVIIICDERTYSVGGYIFSPMNYQGLVLSNLDVNEDLTIDSQLYFNFSQKLAYGGSYNVVIKQNPEYLFCSVTNGIGVDVSDDINNISIICDYGKYSIGGTLVGLPEGYSVDITNQFVGVFDVNTTESITVDGSGDNEVPFIFSKMYTFQASFALSISSIPEGYECASSNSSGEAMGKDITNIKIVCSDEKFSISGLLTGLPPSSVVDLKIQLDNTEDYLTLEGSEYPEIFTFSEKVAYSGNYFLTIEKQPQDYYCTIINQLGYSIISNVTDIEINCSPKLTVSGFAKNIPEGTPLELVLTTDSTSDNISVIGQGENLVSFVFNEKIIPGGSYSISSSYNDRPCFVSNSSSDQILNNVTDVSVDCSFSLKKISDSDYINYSSISFDLDGNIFLGSLFSSNGSGGVYKIPSGQDTPEIFAFNGKDIHSVATDRLGFVYVANTTSAEIWKFNSTGTYNLQLAEDYSFSFPTGITVNDGIVIVADLPKSTLVEINMDGLADSTIDANTYPSKVIADTNNIYFIASNIDETLNLNLLQKISRLDASSDVSADTLVDSLSIKEIAFDQSGNLLIADNYGKIFRLTTSGDLIQVGNDFIGLKTLTTYNGKIYAVSLDETLEGSIIWEITEYSQ